MTIRCPHCGRDGRLPDGLSSPRQFLRCRKCGGRFTAPAPFPAEVAPSLEAPPHGTLASAQLDDELARFGSAAAFLAGLDNNDLDPPSTLTDLGDSNYELTVSLEGELDDSQFEIPAVTVTDPPQSESRSSHAHALTGMEPLSAEPQFYKRIDKWTRICFFGVLGLGALSLVVIGVFLGRALLGTQNINSSTTTLIVAFVGTIAVLLISFTTTALNVLLVDLARNVRRLRIHADGESPTASK
jgi:hypothetical protein